MSRNKGKRGEREAVELLRSHGFEEARRGQQHRGGPDSPDILGGPPGLHLEVKRTERLDLYASIEQATHDAEISETPVVLHRRNGRQWVAILPAGEFLALFKRYQQDREGEA
jgi:Holliday junction resolvase